ncbi:hypothetical protein BACCAC_01929 [Bacteroides caccae ATCC 43185]|nr:hypothetical protein BACCAC_01929 [Bacteroides caccae ATCC 43185]
MQEVHNNQTNFYAHDFLNLCFSFANNRCKYNIFVDWVSKLIDKKAIKKA